MLLTGWKKGIKWSASETGENIVSQGSQKSGEKKWQRRPGESSKNEGVKNADRTAEQSRNSGTQGNSQTELQTDIRIKRKKR